MIAKVFPVSYKNRKLLIIAALLFLLQLVYFQFQVSTEQFFMSFFPDNENLRLLGFKITYVSSMITFVHIAVHASFSVVIVWLLYQDKFNTWFVIILSLILIALYIGTNILGYFTQLYIIQIISTKIRFFLASPLKTIFSIPALKVRD